MVKVTSTTKEDWRNSGNNESQDKVECSEQSHFSPECLNNINRNTHLRNQKRIVHLGNKLRAHDLRPVQIIEHFGLDAFNESLKNRDIRFSGNDGMSERKQEIPKKGFLKFLQRMDLSIDAIQFFLDAKVIDITSETRGIPGKHKGSQNCVTANDNSITQMIKFQNEHCPTIKKDCSHKFAVEETIGDFRSDVCAVEDSVNALVDGVEPATSFQIPVKNVSHRTLPTHKQLYKLYRERQGDFIIHGRNVKATKPCQQECPPTSTDDDELDLFRGANSCSITIPNHQQCYEVSDRSAVPTCTSNELHSHARLINNSNNATLKRKK